VYITIKTRFKPTVIVGIVLVVLLLCSTVSMASNLLVKPYHEKKLNWLLAMLKPNQKIFYLFTSEENINSNTMQLNTVIKMETTSLEWMI